MHLGPFVCLSICPHRTFVFFFFVSVTARRIETIFTVGATIHTNCFIDNYDIIGHVVWQPCWKNRKLWTSVSRLDGFEGRGNCTKEKKLKLGTRQVLMGNK